MTVGVMLKTMSSHELQSWKEYFGLVKEQRRQEELAQGAQQGLDARRKKKGR